MSKVQAPDLSRGPLRYGRNIDDCLIICSTQEEVDSIEVRAIFGFSTVSSVDHTYQGH
ncbi:hypothetical protein KIN20_037394 [Parelaphostrongylus tenuis]|uniref:Uncharacterized protein n=1 Tax=Parelaphostrongylus tenuis TaxID=148309 RepID=A0AAD5WM25_PARTN|nr:hypothetical protein KIN20_037394 [Parelaphostrongylus tenuis]